MNHRAEDQESKLPGRDLRFKAILATPPWDLAESRDGRRLGRHYLAMELDRNADFQMPHLSTDDVSL